MTGTAKTWPRLSVELAGFPRSVGVCQACGAEATCAWQEHDDADRPEPVSVFLCRSCGDRLIGPHPRLYRRIDAGEPFPGAMPCCLGCRFCEALACRHPDLKANGGSGLKLTLPKPAEVFIDGRDDKGRRFGRRQKLYLGPVECAGREGATPA